MSLYGQPRTEFEEITTEDTDISIDISVEGSNEKVVERVAMFALPETPESGEYRCQECGAFVTVGKNGTEYGHQRGYQYKTQDRCPRRPESVDPGMGRTSK